MMTIKQTGLPQSGAHWSYGPDYMRQISERSARNLCGMYPLPRIGYETVVAFNPASRSRLFVQNISGAYFVASTDTRVSAWYDVFGVIVK